MSRLEFAELTADEYRAMSRRNAQESRDSFERCDTDGFLSQWANDLTARKYNALATLADDGGTVETSALFDLDGTMIAAKLIDTRYGVAWGILATDDPHGQIVAWFNPSQAMDDTRARKANARKGYYIGTVRVRGAVTIAGSGKGLSGAASCYVTTVRADYGFSRDAIIIDSGAQVNA